MVIGMWRGMIHDRGRVGYANSAESTGTRGDNLREKAEKSRQTGPGAGESQHDSITTQGGTSHPRGIYGRECQIQLVRLI